MSRPRPAEWLALTGALGLVVTLFADWFSGPGRATATGWSALGWPVLALLLASVALTVALWMTFAAGAVDAWNLIPGVIVAVLAPLALLVVLAVTLLKPDGATQIEPVAWIGLACAALMAGGVTGSLRDERTSGHGRVFEPPPPRPAPPA